MIVKEFLNTLQSPPGWSRTITIAAIVGTAMIAVSTWYHKGVTDSLREQVSLLKAQVEAAQLDAAKSKAPSGNAIPQSTTSIQPFSIKNENIQVNHVPDLRGQLVVVEAANRRLEGEITRLNREVASVTQLREELAAANARIKTRGRLLEEGKKWVREETKREIEGELK